MIGNKNVIYMKLQKGERLDAMEIRIIKRAFKEYEKTHGIWKEHICLYQCSVCKHREFKDRNPNIEFYKFCPSCGAEMEGLKRV